LVARTRQEVNDAEMQEKFIELIKTILVYKFSKLSREDIAAMLRLDDLKQTRVYRDALEEGRQEGRQEGKLEAAVPLLLQAGLTVEQIAEQLQLDLVAVQQVAEQGSESVSQED
jgi:predicted transposase/invertase (TIGR01784 family)